MAAVNQIRFVKNLMGDLAPFKFPVKVAANSTIKRGELCKVTAGVAAALAADEAMAGVIVISDAEYQTGDLAGYHDFIIPRPGDLFEFTLDAAAAPSPGASLYYNTSQILTPTAGTNVIANVCDQSLLPKQGFQSRSPSYDAGTTILTKAQVIATIKAAVSYWAALQL